MGIKGDQYVKSTSQQIKGLNQSVECKKNTILKSRITEQICFFVIDAIKIEAECTINTKQ